MSSFVFKSQVLEWRGPAPYYFAPVPLELCAEIKAAAQVLSYGWGVVPASVEISGVAFSTSLFPRQGGYLVPLKDAVRNALGISKGETITLSLKLGEPEFALGEPN